MSWAGAQEAGSAPALLVWCSARRCKRDQQHVRLFRRFGTLIPNLKRSLTDSNTSTLHSSFIAETPVRWMRRRPRFQLSAQALTERRATIIRVL